MNNDRANLLDLLRLNAGLLPPAEAQAVQQQIQQDPVVRQRWRRLQTEVAEPRRSAGNQRLDTQLVAELFDGRLKADALLELERRCWEDSQLLCELAEEFRFLHLAIESTEYSTDLTHRILGLFPGSARAGADRRGRPAIDPRWQGDGEAADATPLPGIPIELKLVTGKHRSSNRRPIPGGRGRWIAAASVMLAAAGIAWGSWIGFWKNSESSVAESISASKSPSTPASTQEAIPSAEEPGMVSNERGDSTVDEPGRFNVFEEFLPQPLDENNDSHSQASDGGIDSTHAVVMDLPELPIEPSTESDTVDQRDPVASERSAPVQWLDVKGLLAIGSPDSSSWHGPLAVDRIQSGSSVITLPGSWGRAALGSIGQLVIDADTTAAFDFGPTDDELEIRVENGNVAFSELNAGVHLKLLAGEARWDVGVQQPDTTIGIDWLEDRPRLFVARGAVAVDQMRLESGTQLAWQSLSHAEPEPLQDEPQWTKRLRGELKIPSAARKELMTSNDLTAELKAWQTDGSRQEAALAVECLAALQPSQHLFGAIGAEDPRTRNAAVFWLTSLNPQQQRTRRIWQAIAMNSADPTAIRNLYRISMMIRNRRDLDLEQSLMLARFLSSDELVQRQIAATLLVRVYGTGPAIDVRQNSDRLGNLASQWERLIRARYERLQNRAPNRRPQ